MGIDSRTKDRQGPDDLSPAKILMEYVEDIKDVENRLRKGALTNDDRNHILSLLAKEKIEILTAVTRKAEKEQK